MNATIYQLVNLSGREVIRCKDCGRWVDASGGVVLHSRRCDFANDAEVHGTGAQTRSDMKAASKQINRSFVEAGLVATAFGGDEEAIVDAVNAKQITMSDAMNRDD